MSVRKISEAGLGILWIEKIAEARGCSAGSNLRLIDVPISNCIRSGINKVSGACP